MVATNKNRSKLNFSYPQGTLLILLAAILLLFIIISSVNSLADYDRELVISRLRSGVVPTSENISSYLRLVAIITIAGNTLVIGTFAGLVWWGIDKKRWGPGFGCFWLFIFLVNATSFPFYASQKSWIEITAALLNGTLAIVMLVWTFQLLRLKARISQEMTRKKHG